MSADRIVVLAVTRMLSGMCMGGISLTTNRWIRPVKEFSTLLLGDLTYKDKTVMQPFDVVRLSLLKPRPSPPHTEDIVCDFIRERPVCTEKLDNRLQFLEKHSEPDSALQIQRMERSLALIEPSDVAVFFKQDTYSGKYEARIKLPEMGDRPLPVTDIKWRALGRQLLSGKETLSLDTGSLRSRLNIERVFIALGLGRQHQGTCWPLIVGVHTWPDYEAEINYSDL